MAAPSILVVEDERIIAMHLRQQLTRLGYDVPNAVSSGDHALRRIEAAPPDLVLMDIRLRGNMDGIATAAAIPPAYRIPVIYLSSYADDGTLARAAATNPYGYLVKPFAERELHAMIQMTLARCEAERVSRADLERRQQATKMRALSLLAGGVADEVTDLLTVLYDQLEVLGGRTAGEPMLVEIIQDAFGDAIEKERINQRLLDFSGRRTLTPRSVSVPVAVADVISSRGANLPANVTVEQKFPDLLWRASIDAGQFSSSLSNLISNALEAMPTGGNLTIEGRNAVLDRDDTNYPPDVAAGRYVQLSVTDTGTGMPEQVVERAFEPFFTTKPAGGGAGLGLSLVFAFIRRSGGHISIGSKTNDGTTVRIYLPAADEHAASQPGADRSVPEAPADRPAASGNRTSREQAPAAWKFHGRVDRSDLSEPNRGDGRFAVSWHKADNILFASVLDHPGQLRCRLIVEPLPRQNGWDWAVWRPGDTGESALHGRASSVVSAMAAAESAALPWDETRPPDY